MLVEESEGVVDDGRGGVLAVGGGVSGAFNDRSAAKDTIKGDLAVRLSWNPLSRFSTLAAMTSSARF